MRIHVKTSRSTRGGVLTATSRRARREAAGKPYTGEWYVPNGTHVTPHEEPIKAFPSDYKCLCYDGTNDADPLCKECEGTGKRRWYSLREKTILDKGK